MTDDQQKAWEELVYRVSHGGLAAADPRISTILAADSELKRLREDKRELLEEAEGWRKDLKMMQEANAEWQEENKRLREVVDPFTPALVARIESMLAEGERILKKLDRMKMDAPAPAPDPETP